MVWKRQQEVKKLYLFKVLPSPSPFPAVGMDKFPETVMVARAIMMFNLSSLYAVKKDFDRARKTLAQVTIACGIHLLPSKMSVPFINRLCHCLERMLLPRPFSCLLSLNLVKVHVDAALTSLYTHTLSPPYTVPLYTHTVPALYTMWWLFNCSFATRLHCCFCYFRQSISSPTDPP